MSANANIASDFLCLAVFCFPIKIDPESVFSENIDVKENHVSLGPISMNCNS